MYTTSSPRQPQGHIPKRPPHQVLLSIQRSLEPLSGCDEFYVGLKQNNKTKRLHDWKTEHFKALANHLISHFWLCDNHWSQHKMGSFWHFSVRQNRLSLPLTLSMQELKLSQMSISVVRGRCIISCFSLWCLDSEVWRTTADQLSRSWLQTEKVFKKF